MSGTGQVRLPSLFTVVEEADESVDEEAVEGIDEVANEEVVVDVVEVAVLVSVLGREEARIQK